MIAIKYSPAKSSVVCKSKAEQKVLYSRLDKELSYYKDGYFFMPAYEMGFWDGKQHFFSTTTGKFHSGFLSRVLKIIRELGMEVEVTGYPESFPNFDTMPPITLLDDNDGEITLYDHQMSAVRKALQFSRGMWNVATNGGKTEISAGLIKALGIPPTLYVIPRLVLLKQTVERLEKRLGVKVGMVGGSVNKPNLDGVTVAMFQTVNLQLKKNAALPLVRKSKLLLGDECHFLSDARYQNVLEKCPASVRILMSGTTSRPDPVSVGASIGFGGPTLAKIDNDDLVNLGISVKPNVMFLEPNVKLLSKHRLMSMEYNYAIERCLERHEMIAALARAFLSANMQTVIMVAKTEHGKAIHELIPEATFTHGSAKNRTDTTRRLQSGETFCCITTPIFDTGFDIPNIQGLIYAGGGSDEIRLAQSLGRLLRQNSAKDKKIWFVDFIDSFHPVLKKHSRVRQRYFKRFKTFNVTEDLSLLEPKVYNFYMKEISGLKG